MFAALAYKEGEAAGLRKMWKRLFGEPITPQKVSIDRRECFFTASVTRGTRIRWDDLFIRMGRLSREMVLPEELHIPEGCGITRFVPAALGPRVVMNTAADLLAQAGGGRIPVTVVDLRGRLCGMMIPIVRSCAEVRVVTANTAVYRNTCERLMEEYGASVVVCPPGSGSVRGGVVVLPFGGECPVDTAPDTLYIAPEGDGPAGGAVLSTCGIRLGEMYGALRPNGISELLFAAALYEKCAVRGIGSLPAERLTYMGQGISQPDAADLIRRSGDK
ncbi:MAG TPA: hypothetical protein IAB39_04770 [Candidatus Onthovicinus excrementipullorum]|nr:hypothetical protein [Candidatus Onthovicinus excrementipullorum]